MVELEALGNLSITKQYKLFGKNFLHLGKFCFYIKIQFTLIVLFPLGLEVPVLLPDELS